MTKQRKGAARRADIPAEILAELNSGQLETATLVEGLALDFSLLLYSVVPDLPKTATEGRLDPGAGITRRMAQAAAILLDHWGEKAVARLAGHGSDTVRGWAAFALAALPGLALAERLDRVRPLADDPHFGVREWAWLALRPHIAADIPLALDLLTPWTAAASANLRRFAVESTRPRGVWCSHIALLKQQPELGLPLLEAVRADPARYVLDSAANWLNDAAKTRPDWVRGLCVRWLDGDPPPATGYLCKRALRSI